MKKTETVFKSRVEKLRESFALVDEYGILLVDSKDLFYFSGLKATKGFCLATRKSFFVITDFRYVEKFEKNGCFGELVKVDSSYFDLTASLISSLKLKKIFLDKAKTSCEIFSELSERLSNTEFVFEKDIGLKVRSAKNKEELAILKEGARKTDSVFAELLKEIKKGISEKELSLKLEIILKTYGFSSPSFPPIVLFGENTSMPHGEPSEKKLKENEPVLIDFGGVYKEYCTDFTRTLFFGKPDNFFVNLYEKLLNCQLAVLKNAKAGMHGFRIDAIARNCLEKENLGEYFKHGLGHGIGLDIHEYPFLSPFNDEIVEKGSVFTVEPGLYLEGKFGIRIEDMAVASEKGLDVLTEFPKELILIKQE